MGKINKWITAFVFAVISTFTVSCSEQKLELYDTSRSALNIAKGSVFGRVADYPEEYAFNAYFLGGRVTDYELSIPVLPFTPLIVNRFFVVVCGKTVYMSPYTLRQ